MSRDFETAVKLHRQGELDRAELIYRRILDESPNHADALHLLGVIAIQRSQFARAVTLIRQAIHLNPHVATYHSNLAEAARMVGDPSTAVTAARRAIDLAPHVPDAHNHLGLSLQALGRLNEAEAAFRRAIELRPDFALAHNNLGRVLGERGHADEALAAYREAVRRAPNLPLALSNLGQALLETGEADEAERYCREAVRLAEGFADGWSNLGNVLRARDDLAGAKECYRRALQLRPDIAMIHGNLGQALQQEGDLNEAIARYRQAVALDPASPRFQSYLASALAEKDDYAAAAEHYRRALALKSDFPEALNGLGLVLQEQGDFRAAIDHFESALRQKPDFADAYSNLGGVYAELGEMAKSNHYYREALRFDPDHTGALAVLATHLGDKLPAADVETARRFLAREHLSDWKRAALHHGLAHVFDARGEYTLAAEHAASGNAHRKAAWARQGKTYSRAEHSGFVSFVIEQFTPAFFERVRGWGLDTDVPIFVVGMPRSGTTLLEQILASHPTVHGAGELALAKDAFDRVPKWMNSAAPPAACVPQITREVTRQAAEEYLTRLRRLHPTASRIVDKMPDNYLWLGFLHALFPRARFIHSMRDVRDIAVSCWFTNFKQIRWACDPADIADRINDHQRIMNHWRAVLPAPILEVRYEEIVENLEGVARKMIAFCGLEWNPACLAFHQSTRAVRTASLSQVRQPVYKQSVGRWKHYEAALKPLFERLGG